MTSNTEAQKSIVVDDLRWMFARSHIHRNSQKQHLEEYIMEIKEKEEMIVGKLQNNPNLKEQFEKDPAAVVEELIGMDLPNELVNQVVDAVKAKISLDAIGGVLGGLFKK